MLPSPAKYAARTDADVLKLVTENPFAWVVSAQDGSATPLPLRPLVDGEGTLTGLIGHFARSNPQLDVLRLNPRATMLFMGPHGYVSPTWMADKTQAPSWNYASAAFDCRLEFIDTVEELRDLMDDVIGAMEAGRAAAWRLQDMGERYGSLSRGVVGFRAVIEARRPVFKLGQDERDDVFADILAGLRSEGQHALADWMSDFGAGRT